MINNDLDRIKRIVRNLKKEETRMLCGLLNVDTVSFPLVWDKFFEVKKPYKGRAKYNLETLAFMSEPDFEKVIEDYFNTIFNSFFKQEEVIGIYPILNLPINSDFETIKKRFREMAKKLHPDTGGSHDEFLALYKVYEESIKNRNKN